MGALMARIDAGRYNRRITIKKPVDTDTPAGGSIPGWEDVITCWARFKAWKGYERFTAQQVWANDLQRVSIRYFANANINASMRVYYGSKIYNIRNVVDPDQAHREIEMLCEEFQAKGVKK